jgi:hypothetical protein
VAVKSNDGSLPPLLGAGWSQYVIAGDIW